MYNICIPFNSILINGIRIPLKSKKNGIYDLFNRLHINSINIYKIELVYTLSKLYDSSNEVLNKSVL